MEIINKIKESDSIVIEGDRKIGKTTLALYFAKAIEKNSTLISTLDSSKVIKKIKVLSESFDIFNNLENSLSIFTLREDWIELKNKYGYKYILKDLEYLISNQTNKVIIFHKIGSFFEYVDRYSIEDFLSQLLEYGVTYKKKFIFTLDTNNINYDLLKRFFIDNSDIYLNIFMKDNFRQIKILYSLSPITQKEYIFINEKNKLELKSNIDNNTNKNISILFISENSYSKKLHKYLLDKDNIDLTLVNTMTDALSAILKNPDYLIFEQNDDNLNLSICEIAKQNELKTKILYILNKDFIRSDDRIKAKELGCIDMIKIDKNIMNYVIELEKSLDFNFYKKPEEGANIYNNLDEFKKCIKKALKERQLFTIVKIKNILSEEEISFLRNYDKVLITEKHTILLIFNTLKSNVKSILEHKFNKNFDIEEIYDCLDIFEGK